MDNLKRCSKCKKEKSVYEFRGENRTCNKCCERKNLYYQNNRETILEKRNQEAYTCPLCNIEIKTYRKAIHEKSVGHQYYLQQHEKNEEPEKPDVIYLHNGVRHFMCFGCKTCCVESMWGSHMLGKNGVEHFENKKKYEERKKENPNSDEMKINRFWLRKSIA